MTDIGNSEKRKKDKGQRIKGKSFISSVLNLHPRKFSSGFTLLEVMVAVAIVAITLVTLLGLGNRSIDINGRLQKITQATLLAQHKMSEIETLAEQGGFDFQPAEGIFDPPFEDYRWQTRLEDFPILPAIQMVTVVVAWGEERTMDTVDLTSFLRPGGSL
jgi:general secretion pathway protein I